MRTVIHVFGTQSHHYVPMHAFFSKISPSVCRQLFWVQGERGDLEKDRKYTYYTSAKELAELMHQQPEDCTFILHGLFDRALWPKLLFSALPSKCYWVCWGNDMYQHLAIGRPWKEKVMYLIHKLLTYRFKCVVALNEGDGKLINKLLWHRAVLTIPYPLIGSDAKPSDEQPVKPIRILVGNSAASSNEHLSALQWLSKYKSEAIKVILPLNYGGESGYIKEVKEMGDTLFGDKFCPIVDMLDKKDYDELLVTCDILVFAHRRQQGLYVVYSMLKYGKKIFIRKGNSSFDALTKGNFSIYNSESIVDLPFDEFVEFPNAMAEKNTKLMTDKYSEEALLPIWESLLTS